MSFTFDVAKVGSEALHRVRVLVGDTVSNGYRVDDATITAFLVEEGLAAASTPVGANEKYVLRAAVATCRAIASGLSKNAEIAVTGAGPVKSDAARAFADRANELEARATPWMMT